MTRSISYLRIAALLPLFKLLFASVVHAFPSSLRPSQFDSADNQGWISITAKKAAEGNPAGIVYLLCAVVLVLLGGVFAGLTIALMGQDEIYLQVLASSGEESERKNASKVLRLMKRGKHWVLVSLLLSNVITNETLPIMLDRSLGGGWQAVVGSTVLIVIFGEVVPQSICVRYGLPIGAFMSSSVLILMWILAPIAWPTAKLLDRLLGEDHGTTYKKAGLKTLVTLHRTLGTSPDERLNHDEVTIISAVLDLKAKPVGSIMTPMEDVFTLSADTILDDDMMNTILSEGYSRIPIYAVGDPENFIGMLLVKMLITYDPEDCAKVEEFHLATLPETRPETSCLDIINFFQEGKSHMILVSESPGEPNGALGVCTLEDVIEELIGEEIVDESDVFVDVHKAIRRMNPVPYYRLPKAPLNPLEDTTLDENDALTKAVSHSMERKLSTISDINLRGHNTKLIRRRNSGGTENLAVQKKSDELRAHLKHLGPSNLASKPKTTRINAVKIKPGQPAGTTSSAPSPHISKHSEPTFQRNASHNANSGVSGRENRVPSVRDESTGLLAAGFEASDGVHAVGYGTLGSSPTSKARIESEDSPLVPHARAALIARTKSEYAPSSAPLVIEVGPSDSTSKPNGKQQWTPKSQVTAEESAVSEAKLTDDTKNSSPPKNHNLLSLSQSSKKAESTSSLPAKLIVNPEQDAAPSDDEAANPDENSSGSTVKSSGSMGSNRKNTARSGSIQEREIPNLSGVRKMVLDVHDEEPSDRGRQSPTAEGESTPLLSESAILDGSADEGSKADGDKKKKRKKKRSKKKKTSKDGEENGVGV